MLFAPFVACVRIKIPDKFMGFEGEFLIFVPQTGCRGKEAWDFSATNSFFLRKYTIKHREKAL